MSPLESLISELREWQNADTGDDWIRAIANQSAQLQVDIDVLWDGHGIHEGYRVTVYAGDAVHALTAVEPAPTRRAAVDLVAEFLNQN